jgi:hypothetical protein
MELDKTFPERLTELKGELSALSRVHREAWESAIYIGMNEEEGNKFDQAGERIHELYVEYLKYARENTQETIAAINLSQRQEGNGLPPGIQI